MRDNLNPFRGIILTVLGGLILWAAAIKVVWAEEVTTIAPNKGYFQTEMMQTQTMWINPYPNIVIACAPGTVTINTKDGSVKFDNCEPDEGARAFWAAVTRMFPGAR
jgi:hypothetical protein